MCGIDDAARPVSERILEDAADPGGDALEHRSAVTRDVEIAQFEHRQLDVAQAPQSGEHPLVAAVQQHEDAQSLAQDDIADVMQQIRVLVVPAVDVHDALQRVVLVLGVEAEDGDRRVRGVARQDIDVHAFVERQIAHEGAQAELEVESAATLLFAPHAKDLARMRCSRSENHLTPPVPGHRSAAAVPGYLRGARRPRGHRSRPAPSTLARSIKAARSSNGTGVIVGSRKSRSQGLLWAKFPEAAPVSRHEPSGARCHAASSGVAEGLAPSGAALLLNVAPRDREGVTRVEGQRGGRFAELLLEDPGDALFACAPVAGDPALDECRRVLRRLHPAFGRDEQDHPARLTEPQRRADALAVERGLDREHVGLEGIDLLPEQARQLTQARRNRLGAAAELPDPHRTEPRRRALEARAHEVSDRRTRRLRPAVLGDVQRGIADEAGSGVDAEDSHAGERRQAGATQEEAMQDSSAQTGFVALLLAAGQGTRLGLGRPKAQFTLRGRSLLEWSARRLARLEGCRGVQVAMDQDTRDGLWSELAPELGSVVGLTPCLGGTTRQDSCRLAYESAVAQVTDFALVAVHDAARPFFDLQACRQALRVAAEHGGAVLGHAAIDTLKRVDREGRVLGTIDRGEVFQAATPQVFRRAEFERMLAHAAEHDTTLTDEAGLAEACGVPVQAVPAPATNLKITRPEDLLLARGLTEFLDEALPDPA